MQRFGVNLSYREYLADAVVHVLGVAAALVGATALIVWAALSTPQPQVLWLVIYATGLVASFAFSAAYNLTLHPRLRPILRRFDHAAIYVMIAGTYTPVALIGIGGTWGGFLAASAWVLALIGAVLKLGFFERVERLGLWLYLGQGWLAVIAVVPMLQSLPVAASVLVGLGGVIYTAGTLVLYRESLRYSQALWHGFVLVGAALHYSAVIALVAHA